MTEEFRPRQRRSRNRTPLIVGVSATVVAGLSLAGLHTLQTRTVEDLETMVPSAAFDEAYETPQAEAFREHLVFSGPEWTAHSVMVEAATASERLERAGEVLDRTASVWLPWLSVRAEEAAGAYLGNDPAAQRETEFRIVYDQTKAACEAPSTGIETAAYIDAWTAVGHREVTEWSSSTVTPDHSQDVTAAAYKAAMAAGLEFVCPGR